MCNRCTAQKNQITSFVLNFTWYNVNTFL